MSKTKKMNTYLKYGLILVACAVCGGIIGYHSVAFEGNLMRDYTPSKLKAELISVIVGDSTEKKENVLKKTFKR